MVVPYALLFAALTALASLPSLLTFSRLWQIKEWRIDRLREHLRENGWFRQLLGWFRPLVTAVLLVVSGFPIFGASTTIILALFVLAVISVAQVILSDNRPIWTTKAKAVVSLSGGEVALAAFSLSTLNTSDASFAAWVGPLLLILPLLAPGFVVVCAFLLKPLDWYLKNRILKRATTLRLSHPRLRVIGITGSVGKTTVKEMLAHLLKDRGAATTPARVNTEMGVAAWMTSVLRSEPADSDRILIVEMGAYRRNEIALLCRITKPTIGVITYVGDQHMSLFGSREAIIEGKGELFAALPVDGKAFGNKDNDAFGALAKKCSCTLTSVGTDHHADLQATDVEETATGIRFRALETLFSIPIAGTHNVTGALLAIAVAKELGMKPHELQAKFQSFRGMKQTFEVKMVGGVCVLDDTYNSSPASVRAAIAWAQKQPQTTKILVLEGIIELGDAESSIHIDLAALAAPVFTEAYAAHPRYLTYLREGGFGPRAHMATERRGKVEPGSLVVFCGRLAPSVMARFI